MPKYLPKLFGKRQRPAHIEFGHASARFVLGWVFKIKTRTQPGQNRKFNGKRSK